MAAEGGGGTPGVTGSHAEVLPGDRPRVGVFGGTFDPPHVGHQIVAQDVFEALALDLLLVIPAGDPPHREAVLPARIRHSLVVDAFLDDPRVEVSDLEIRREGPSYTVETLERLRELRDPSELLLVVGADQLASFDEWHRPDDVVKLATLVAVPRGGQDVPEPRQVGLWPYRRVDVTRVDVSGSQIRDRLRRGRSVRYLVPESVREALIQAWSEHAV